MKRLAYPFTSPTARAVAGAVLLATVALTGARPAHAASVAPGQVTAVKASAVDRAEARIKELHTKLNITQTQELTFPFYDFSLYSCDILLSTP